ncbi:hypothetical protein TNIN_219021 [Trichonephila inaurata madagascariensis]|uniref:Uncharacterized protein n=1 Tax=Trichonephila inaurata madagascariensis TaxID=2747483 RepID=A0A8X6XWW5_9ARAC|nr:hypothetical protein TNIN_219021 [Trichonephila inaurata madagascariensis]
MLVRLGCVLWLCGLTFSHIMSLPVFAVGFAAGCRCLPAFDTAVPNSGFAIRASLPDFLCPGCRSFESLYLPMVLMSPFVDAALQAAGSSHPPPNYCSDL